MTNEPGRDEPNQDESDQDAKPSLPSLPAQVAGLSGAGLAGAVFGMLAGGTPGALSGAALGAGWGPLFTASIQTLSDQLFAKLARVSATAQAAADMDEETFWERVIGDPELLALSEQVWAAARRTGRDEHLDALGRLLGQAVTDDKDKLVSGLLVRALDDLDAPHIVMLETLDKAPPDDAPAWHINSLQQATTLDRDIAYVCLQQLRQHGLVHENTGNYGGGVTYDGTELGRRLLGILHLPAA